MPTISRPGIPAPGCVALLSLPAVAHGQMPTEMQSVLDARGGQAAGIVEITWVLFVGGALIFAAVMVLVLVALVGPRAARSAVAGRAWIIGGGIVFPVVVLSALLLYTLAAASAMVVARQAPAAVRIEVTGELWWWRVRYLDASGKAMLETANEIRIPVGQPVDLDLVSDNVIHSFWVPNLAGKVDMIPGRVNRLRVRADGPGLYRGQCAEYCGAQHARMALHVVALGADDYATWLAAHRKTAAEPADALSRRGQALFAERRCGLCHTIRGSRADGVLGPDLTHVGSRLSLAAGTLPNRADTVARWITDGQHIKPGNLMPSFRHVPQDDLRALAGYLAGLE